MNMRQPIKKHKKFIDETKASNQKKLITYKVFDQISTWIKMSSRLMRVQIKEK